MVERQGRRSMDKSSTLECKYKAWYWLNASTGEIKPFNCGSWSCPIHGAAVRYKWACRVAQAHPERMITFTNIPLDKTSAYLAYKQTIRDIRAEGIRMEYCRFLEVGAETGMRHFHLAQRGDYIPKRWLSSRASANGLGRIVDIEKCYGAGPQFYLTKYITKDEIPLPPGWRKVASSRGFFPAVREVPSDLRSGWQLVRGT